MTENKVNVRGAGINYLIHGDGPEVLLCIPGELGCWRTDYGPILDRFDEKKFTLVIIDPPGHGKSLPPYRKYYKNYSRDDAHIMAEVMERLNYTSFSVLGFSEGGRTALHLAHNYPLYVRKVIVWGIMTRITEQAANIYTIYRDVRNWQKRKRELFESIYGINYLSETWEAMCEFYISIHDEEPEGNLPVREILPEITNPVLVLHGSKGGAVRSQEENEWMVDQLPKGRFAYNPSAGFELHLQVTDWFMKIVEDFLVE